MPQSSSPGSREEAGPGRKGRERGRAQAGRPAEPGGERAWAPGRGARLSRARLASPLRQPLPVLSPALPVPPTPGERSGQLNLPRAGVRPLGATKAGGSREVRAETPGCGALQPHVERSSAWPPLTFGPRLERPEKLRVTGKPETSGGSSMHVGTQLDQQVEKLTTASSGSSGFLISWRLDPKLEVLDIEEQRASIPRGPSGS
ncbi:uncharacterized protein LOC124991528 [Sciurus carolinensis]|uniref:uncharacterized protein LOC124991528 n=1 Tax=Sciurus carolinensis TaxID=30640 RepID=UPI001FB55FDE|nr:uncharacterized protein LOC124991528 [Sciurus carolinensis]